MANEVFFKRGPAANLPSAAANITDGCFYLTTDTDRLYVGQTKNGVKTLVELNKSITVVSTTSELPTTGVAAGQFYYVSTPNVLCEYNGTSWNQINPDTRLKAENQNTSVSTGTNSATVTSDVEEDLTTGAHHSIGSFTIAGDSNLDVSVSGNTITLAPNITNITSNVNTRYTVSTSAHTGGGADINLTSSDTTPVVDTVSIVGTNAATVSQANDVITINVDNPVTTVEAEFDVNGDLTIDASVNGNHSTADTVTPIIALGGTANDDLNSNGYKFISGTATLPVYTKKQTEERINVALSAADAMTYKGVVGTGANQSEANTDAASKLVSTANAGDTYKVYQNITSPVSAKAGDLVIAEGTDGAVTWVVIPSGDDQVITGETSALTIEVHDGAGELTGATFVPGTHISLSGDANGTSDTHTNITIAQAADYTAQTVTGSTTAITQTGADNTGSKTTDITYISGIATDTYGNVVNSSVKTQTVTLIDTHNHLTEIDTSVSASGNVATVTIGATDEDQSTITDGTFSIGSSNLTITNSGTAITANLEWGTF